MIKKLEIKEGEKLIIRGRTEQGLTGRGRAMKVSQDQTVLFTPPNKYHEILLTHISGPLAGVSIYFQTALGRKAKPQDVCKCSAYSYPHAKGRGQCQK